MQLCGTLSHLYLPHKKISLWILQAALAFMQPPFPHWTGTCSVRGFVCHCYIIMAYWLVTVCLHVSHCSTFLFPGCTFLLISFDLGLWSAFPPPLSLMRFAAAGISSEVRTLYFSHISGTHSGCQPTLKGTCHNFPNIAPVCGCNFNKQV